MSRANPLQRQQMRQRIAQAAARLIAEDGIQDYAQAKRKAARQLGAEDSRNLPGNGEVEQELRAYQNLYQREEQEDRLHELRALALDVMILLEPFEPRLTGSVLSGTATRHSNVNLEVRADDPKEVELFFLNRRIPYRSGEKPLRLGGETRGVPLFLLTGYSAEVEVLVLSVADCRSLPRAAPDGSLLRARRAQVEALQGGDCSAKAI